MDPIVKGFQNELSKLGLAIPPQVLNVGVPAAVGAVLSGLAIHDLIKGHQLNEPFPANLITGGGTEEQVTARPWIKKILEKQPLIRPVVPVTTEAGIEKMLEDPKFGIITRMELKPFADDIIARGTNAAVIQGDEKDYVIIPKKVNPRIAEHEIGHLQDFARKLNEDPGFFRNLLSMVWKPEYAKNILEKERRAWKYAQKTPVAEQAMKTYERAFHVRRAGLTTPMALSAFMAGLGGLLKGAQ